jgi:hypothetical protein
MCLKIHLYFLNSEDLNFLAFFLSIFFNGNLRILLIKNYEHKAFKAQNIKFYNNML